MGTVHRLIIDRDSPHINTFFLPLQELLLMLKNNPKTKERVDFFCLVKHG